MDDIDDEPTPIDKLPQAREYAQLIPNFVVEHSLEFLVVDMMKMHSFMGKLNKMLISIINKHHQKTLDSYFYSV